MRIVTSFLFFLCSLFSKHTFSQCQTAQSLTNVSICQANLPYFWNGQNLVNTGTYYAYLKNASNCDSVARLNLTVNYSSTSTSVMSVCSSSLPFVWNGISCTTSGTYSKKLTSSKGCDSIAILMLTVRQTTTSTTNVAIYASEFPYTWNSVFYNAPGTYTVHFTNYYGCDSAAKLNLLSVPDVYTTVQDSLALVDLYTNTAGASWYNNKNWLSGKPVCTWKGIDVNGLTGRVQRIELQANNLQGNLPSSIGNLTSLIDLILDSNSLTGPIPATIGNLTKINYLYLFNNHLTGTIPSSISNMTKAREIFLQKNHLEGLVPPSVKNLILNTTSPYYFSLNIGDNQLTGDPSTFIPIVDSTKFDQLDIDISNNKFNFEGIEKVIQQNSSIPTQNTLTFTYSPQARIPLFRIKDKLSVSAGGTLSNNIYKWYNGNVLVATIIGDSTYTPTAWGAYGVTVTNTVATKLTLNNIDPIQANILTAKMCNGANNKTLTSNISGTSYQWQSSNDGISFSDINDNSMYTNTQTASLQITNIPSSLYDQQYRCNVDGIVSGVYTLQFVNTWLRDTLAAPTPAWENPANWTCGAVPDANTDVIIYGGTVIIGLDAYCRTLFIKPGAVVIVNEGVTLTVTH